MSSSKRAAVVPYVVGVEYCPIILNSNKTRSTLADADVESTTRIRWTDVTPRYAHSWIASLRRRGIWRGNKSTTNMEEAVSQSWWSRSLQSINKYCDASCQQQHKTAAAAIASSPQQGKCVQDAIVLDNSCVYSEDDETSRSKLPSLDKQQQQQQIHDTLDTIFDAEASMERAQLNTTARQNEAIPTSKAAFQTHPLYVIAAALGKAQVLVPDAKKRICGVFKGQLVYRREDASTARTATKWLYQGRQVRPSELARPVKIVKARKKAVPKTFRALRSYGVGTADQETAEFEKDDDGMEKLYGHWQTEAWSPAPVGPTDPIPVNEYNNIELELLPPGLVHVDQTGLAATAKKLGLPYAPCLVGFDGHGGNRTPTIRGVVVHVHNEALLREAGAQVHCHTVAQEHHNRRQAVLLRWKRLMVGLLTKERLDRQYGDHQQQKETATEEGDEEIDK